MAQKRNHEITLNLHDKASEDLSDCDFLHHQAMDYYNHGCYHQSEQFLMLALEGKERVAGRDANTTLSTAEQLGHVCWAQDNINEAKHMFERSRDGFCKVFGENGLSTLRNVLNIGFLCCLVGSLEEAENMLRWAYNGRRSLTATKRLVLSRLWDWNQEILKHEEAAWNIYLTIKEKLGIYLYS